MSTDYTTLVTDWYQAVQFRAPPAADLAVYVAGLTAGATTDAQVQQAIENDPYTQDIVNPVIREYQAAFGRVPLASGEGYWVNVVAADPAALSGELSTVFASSPEFEAQYGTTSPNQIATASVIAALYQNVLGRPGAAAGIAYWTAQNLTVAQALYVFSQSAEFISSTEGAITAFQDAQIAGDEATSGSLFQYSTTSFTLTPGADTVSNVTTVYGTLEAALFNQTGPTLNSNDVISNVKNLVISDDYGAGRDIIPAGAQLSSITNIALNTAGNAGTVATLGGFGGTSFDTSGITGVKTLTVTSSGGGVDSVNASSTTAVTDNQSASGGGVQVTGGGDVTVTSNGSAGVQIGSASAAGPGHGGLVPTAAQLPTGNVTVTENGTGSVAVYGGVAVTVDVASTLSEGSVNIGNTLDNTGDSTLGGATNPTGAINVTDASLTGDGAIVIFGGASVTVHTATTNVVVGDPEATLASNESVGDVNVTAAQPVTFDGLVGTGHNSVPTATVDVFGGANVTVTSNTGGEIYIGSEDVVAATPTGNVLVTDTSSNLDGAFGLGDAPNYIQVEGGKDVSVTAGGAGVDIGGDFAPSGTVLVTETTASYDAEVQIDGGNGVTVNAQGQEVVIGSNSGTAGAQVVNQASVYSGNALGSFGHSSVEVDGGTTVTINTTGGDVTVGTPSGAADKAVHVPTGAVNIKDTFSGAGSANGDEFSVLGGATVNITVTNTTDGDITVGALGALDATGTTNANAALDPTGNVVINNSVTNGSVTTYGTSFVTVHTNGATSVSVTGSDGGVIADANQLAASSGNAVGTSSLTTVNLDGGTGEFIINSGVFSALTIADSLKGSTATTVTTTPVLGTVVTEGPHSLALTLSNDSNAETALTDATATAVTVSTSGVAADNIDLTLAKATSLTFANSATVNLGAAETVAAGATITSTGSGALNLGDVVEWAGSVKSISSTTAAVTATINGDTTTFAGGSAGGNSVTVETSVGMNGVASLVTAGGSNNTVTLTNTAALYNSLLYPLNPVFNDFTGFQNLGLAGPVDGQPGVSGAYNVAGFNSVNISGEGGALTLNSATAGESLTFSNAAPLVGKATVWDLGTYTGTDSLTVNLAALASTASTPSVGIAAGTLDTTTGAAKNSGIETLTVNSLNATTAGGANTLTIVDPLTTTINITGNGALTLTDNAAKATGVTTINASVTGNVSSGAIDVTNVQLSNATNTVTGGSGMLTVNLNNYAKAGNGNEVDNLTAGAGGVTATLGDGNQTGKNTGGENVTLTASTVRDTLIALDAPGKAGVGTNANITGFHNFVSGAPANSDVLRFQTTAGLGGTASPKTVIANTAVGTTVTGGTGSTYTINDGVFTLVAPNGVITGSQELSDVQALIDGKTAGAGGGNNEVGAVQIGTATYVVTGTTAGGVADGVLQLNGVSGITGFGNATDSSGANPIGLGAGTTIDVANADIVLAAATHGGAGIASITFNDAGFSSDTLSNDSAAGITTTYSSLANSAMLNVSGGITAGNVVVSQIGTSPQLVVMNTDGSDDTIGSLSYSGSLVVDGGTIAGGDLVIKSLIDIPGTDAAVWVTGGSGTAIDLVSITDSGLTTINASNDLGSLILGGTTAGMAGTTPLTQAGLTVLGSVGALTVTASGAGDHITGQNGGDFILASGSKDVIVDGSGINTITANGAGDSITVGANQGTTISIGNGQVIHAAGAGDTITFATAAKDGTAVTWSTPSTVDGGLNGVVHLGVGAGDTINFGNNTGGGSQTVYITGDLAGAGSGGAFKVTTLNNVVSGHGDTIVFANQPTEHTAYNIAYGYSGFGIGHSQVNVASATTLAQALDLAAATDAQAGQNSTTGQAGYIAAHTGVLDWFQFGGNTYVVEAINSTATQATHTALAAGDAVVAITGLVDLSNAHFHTGGILTL